MPLPSVEGVYDIVITAVNSPKWSQAVRQPFSWKRTIAERRVQLLVLNPKRPPAEADSELTQVLELEPANPRWYDKFNKLPQIQLSKRRLRLPKGPFGNDCFQMQRHPLGDLAQLKPNADSPDVSWEAYWLPLSQPGRPHIVEIEYPSDVPQTLGVSILEPTAAGGLAPLVVNSSVANFAEPTGVADKPRWQRHRVIFWPRTDTPLLVISNGAREGRPSTARFACWPPASGCRGRCPTRRGQPAAAGGVSRTPVDLRKLRRQRVSRSSDGTKPQRLGDVLRRRHAAGRVSQPHRPQRADARRVDRRQHDLPQHALAADTAI